MNELNWFKKHKDIVYSIAIVIAFVIGTLFGDGVIWKTKEIELRKNELELESLRESVSLREKKAELFNKIVQLNNDFYDIEKKKMLNEGVKKNFINHFEILFNNFNEYEKKLAQLENRKIQFIIIPTPIKDNIPPSMIQGKVIDPTDLEILF